MAQALPNFRRGQTAVEPVHLREDVDVLDARVLDVSQAVEELRHTCLFGEVPAAWERACPFRTAIVVEPECVHCLYHRPVICFKPYQSASL